MTTNTEQNIVTFSSKSENIGAAVEKAAANLQARLNELGRLGRAPVVVSVSHSAGYTGYTGHFASIVAVIEVTKNPSAR